MLVSESALFLTANVEKFMFAFFLVSCAKIQRVVLQCEAWVPIFVLCYEQVFKLRIWTTLIDARSQNIICFLWVYCYQLYLLFKEIKVIFEISSYVVCVMYILKREKNYGDLSLFIVRGAWNMLTVF